MEPKETVDVITQITYIFFIYLLMAVFVERSVEIYVSIFNYCDLKWKRYKVWNRRAEQYRDKLDRLYNFDPSAKVNNMFSWLLWGIVSEPSYSGGKFTISATTIRTKYLRVYTRVVANIIALILVYILHSNFKITFVDVVQRVMLETPTLAFFKVHDFWGVIISAVAVAAGVEPLHALITKVEKAGKKKS